MSETSNTTQTSNTIQRKPLIELLPQWILVFIGIVYAAGFLVVLNFLDRFGIREAGSDFWKTRYIHIGILCLAFPLIFNGTILSLGYLIFHGKFDKTIMRQRLLPIGLLVTNLEFVCYFLITFTHRAPGGGSIAGLIPLLSIVVVTLLGVPTLLFIDRKVENIAGGTPRDGSELKPDMQWLSVNARRVLASVVVCLDVWYFAEFIKIITGFQLTLALTYVGFSILLGVMISTVAIYEKRQLQEDRRKAIDVLAASIIVPFFYLVVLAFSYGVFQHIPATRGGGDYTMSPKVILTLKSAPTTSPVDVKYFGKENSQVTIPLILVEETGWAFYLADPLDAGGPAEWKTIGGRKPEILIVNKTEVTKLQLESRNTKKIWQSP